MGKWCLHASSFIFDWIIIKVAGKQDRHESSVEFNFGPNQTTHFGVTCPWVTKISHFWTWISLKPVSRSCVGFLLLQCSSGVVRYPRDLQVSVATRSCRVLIFASSQYLSVIDLFPVMIHWWVRKPSRGPNNCMFWAMIEAEGEVGYP